MKTIVEGNKLIAEFYKECKYVKYENKTFLKCEGDKWKFPQTNEINKLYNNFPIADGNLGGVINPDFTLLKFHSSWDWLMPVVEKINNLKSLENDKQWYDFVIQNNQTVKDDYDSDKIYYENDNPIIPKIYSTYYSTYIGIVGK
jgi:hypothetical protein